MEDRFAARGDYVVLDRETGLMWERGASGDRMVWHDGFTYVDLLNKSRYGGFDDWRYPTREEMSTLLASDEDRSTGLFCDPIFGCERNFWTSSEKEHHRACYIDFYYGDVYVMEENYANLSVRAVRSNPK